MSRRTFFLIQKKAQSQAERMKRIDFLKSYTPEKFDQEFMCDFTEVEKERKKPQ